ncbi:aspartate dehydrogenase [Mesorhizobium sp. SB112]|uniref:aspartate dehydrogenase n=1 Tax=Mesorhizobium sp. SB112 TaxID=3151853 RepID=UPI0032641EA3
MSAFERICLIGWGAIAQRVCELLRERNASCRIVGVAVRDAERDRPAFPDGAMLLIEPAKLMQCAPSLVVEAAGRSSVKPWGEASLRAGLDFMISSTSALAENDVLQLMTDIAERSGGRIIVPPGALGGVDALSAASRVGLDRVVHRIVKPPAAWRGTAAEQVCDLTALTDAMVFFEGNAAQAASAYPQNANVAVITSLAGVGFEKTRIELVADPDTQRNVHQIHAEGDFGVLDVRLENLPLKTNPKSSEMTALNLVRAIENRSNKLVL